MKIAFANLNAQYIEHKEEIDIAIQSVLDSGQYILGPQVLELEDALQSFVGSHAITCANGTDALRIALMAANIQPGDEVITTPFTFIATAEMIASIGAKPVFVDIAEHDFNIDVTKIDSVITPKTKAIIPVSLYGQTAEMDTINAIARKYGLTVIEDAAQSFGATYKGRRSCNLSAIATTSFFPAKPLGCYGDGGAIFCRDSEQAEKIMSLRNHGQVKRYHHKYIGENSRLDTLQAAVLCVKLKYYEKEMRMRQAAANHYGVLLKESSIIAPTIQDGRTSVWAQYTIRVENRELLQTKMNEAGIPTAVHYPRPLHLQEAFAYCGGKAGDFPVAELLASQVLSLPMSAHITEEEIKYVCEQVANV